MKKIDSQLIQKVLLLAIPLIISNITVPLVGLINTALVGHLNVQEYLVALSVGVAVFGFIFQLFFFLRMSSVGLVAQLTHQGNHQQIYNIIVQYALFALVVGVVLILTAPWIYEICLSIYALDIHTAALFYDYLYIRLLSAPAAIAMFLFLGFFVGIQQVRHALYVSILINSLTIVFGLLFVFYYQLNLKGIALADTIAQYSGLIYALIITWLYLKQKQVSFIEVKLFHQLHYLFSLNIDILIRTFALVSALFLFSIFSAYLGAVILVVNTIILQIQSLTALALDGFANATETLCGQYAHEKQSLRKILLNTAIASAITSLIISMLYISTLPYILSFLTSDPAIIQSAYHYQWFIYLLPVVSVWCFWLDGVFTGLLRTKDMRNTMLFSVAIFLIMAYLSTYGNNYLLFSSLLGLFILRAITLGFRLKYL